MSKIKIVYCTPSLYIAGGVERVLTLKANYLANLDDKYDVTIILTDGQGKKPFYDLSLKVRIINLNIGFEDLWTLSFIRKIPTYLRKQRLYKKKLTQTLTEIRPDITISTLRREINFINDIIDGSIKIGEIHVNRQHYRNFEEKESNWLKDIFSKWWMWRLTKKLKNLDKFIVLTNEDKESWKELNNVLVIPDPLPYIPQKKSQLTEKRVIAVGRYAYQKGFDMLLQAWKQVEERCPEWQLDVFGDGDRTPYEQQIDQLGIDRQRCRLNTPTQNIQQEYINSSVFVFSSRFEGFGMALLEAISHGLAVVSFDCPCGPKDIITNEKDGLLVENCEPIKLAEAIIRVTKNEKLRQSLGNAAYESAQQYSIDVIGQKWDNIFNEITHNN